MNFLLSFNILRILPMTAKILEILKKNIIEDFVKQEHKEDSQARRRMPLSLDDTSPTRA